MFIHLYLLDLYRGGVVRATENPTHVLFPNTPAANPKGTGLGVRDNCPQLSLQRTLGLKVFNVRVHSTMSCRDSASERAVWNSKLNITLFNGLWSHGMLQDTWKTSVQLFRTRPVPSQKAKRSLLLLLLSHLCFGMCNARSRWEDSEETQLLLPFWPVLNLLLLLKEISLKCECVGSNPAEVLNLSPPMQNDEDPLDNNGSIIHLHFSEILLEDRWVYQLRKFYLLRAEGTTCLCNCLGN